MACHPIDYRYGSEEMREIFSEATRVKNILKAEAALIAALAEKNICSKECADEVAKKINEVKLERVHEIEKQTHHDVFAIVQALTELCSDETKKYIHLTATSYDVVDPAISMQLNAGKELLVRKAKTLLKTILGLAEKHKATVMVGRTHGQHATPTTFGFKLANYADSLGRAITELERVSVPGKFSGAVGTYAAQKAFGVDVEQAVLQNLKLQNPNISTQVVSRTYHAQLVSRVIILCCVVEQIAKEIRNLQRTEINEVAEAFAEKQVGSSAMAQKKNPWNCENICGNARIIRSLALPAFENISLEHERDLTNSACERSLFPTLFVLADDVVFRMGSVLSGLVVNEEKMKENLALTQGRVYTEAIMNALVKKGIARTPSGFADSRNQQSAKQIVRMPRQEAHEVLKKCAMQDGDFKEILLKEKVLPEAELDEVMKNYIGRAVEKTQDVVKKWKI